MHPRDFGGLGASHHKVLKRCCAPPYRAACSPPGGLARPVATLNRRMRPSYKLQNAWPWRFRESLDTEKPR